MEVGIIIICITLGALICFVSFGVGVCFGRDSERHNSTICRNDNNSDIYIPFRYRNRSRDNGCDLSNEELAAIVDGMMITGIAPSRYEKECLKEAANRLRNCVEDFDDGK